MARHCTAAHCWAAYATACIASLLLAPVVDSRWPAAPLFNGLLLTCAATVVVYAFSFSADNSSVYDPYWVLAPLHLAFVWKAAAPGGFWYYEPRETACMVLLWAWALRFIVMVPWEGWTRGLAREDWRYNQIREQLVVYGQKARTDERTSMSHPEPQQVQRVAGAGAVDEVLQPTSDLAGSTAYWCVSFVSLHLTPTLLVYAALCPLGRVVLQVTSRNVM